MPFERLELVYDAQTIERRVRELGEEINALYAGRQLVMICVLKGAFMFFSDLVKHVTLRPEIDFVRLASYGDSDSSSRDVRFDKDVELSLENKDVLVVEDIVDSGRTLDVLLRRLRERGARSLRVAVLLDKAERREVATPVDVVGFSLPSGFVVGYGLDYAERYRELPAIYTLHFE